MSNNYRRYFEYELQTKLAEAAHLKTIADRCEATWRRTKAVRDSFQRALERCIALETEAKEKFRSAHSALSSVRQEVGELQDELFRTCEEQES